MKDTRTLSIVALFTSLIVATDWLMAYVPNVKLLDTLVFASSYSFGFKVGAYIAILSELIWGIFNPWGFGGFIIAFTIAGELLYAAAGSFASRIWSVRSIRFSTENIAFGAIISICAFFFDLETNIATAFLLYPHPSFLIITGTILFGLQMMITHELADFIIGAALAPAAIVYFSRRFPRVQTSTEASVRVPVK